MLRKVVLIMMAVIMMVGFVACGGESPSSDPTASTQPDSSAGSDPTDSAASQSPATDSSDASPTPTPVAGGTLYQLTDSSSQMMSYVIATQSKQVIVLDGGYARNKTDIINLAKEITGQEVPEIEAWFFSHTHSDHVNAFSELLNEGSTALKIKKVYYSLLTRPYVEKNEPGSLETYDNFVKALGKLDAEQKVSVQQGQEIVIDGLTMEVLLIPDESAKMITTGVAVNESSVIYRLTIGGQRVLFLGDAYQVAGTRLRRVCQDDITADVVQMAHHGSQGVQQQLYKLIAPKACLWPAPQMMWDEANQKGGSNPNLNLETVELHRYMRYTLGVKHHYIAKDGVQELVFPLDLD